MTACVFKLALHSLNTLREQQKLLASLDRLHNANRSSEEQIKSLWREVYSPPAELESVRSEVSRPEASLKAVNRQLATAHAAFTAVEPEFDQNQALVDAEA